MEHVIDEQVTVPFYQATKQRFSDFIGCSFDKGFYSPANRIALEQFFDVVTLPKKGKLSQSDKEREYSEEFVQAKQKHSAIESAINALENHGLDRCRDHGISGFKRYVGLAVVARNLQILGHHIQQEELKRYQKKQRAA